MLNNRVVFQSWQDSSVEALFQSYGAVITRDPYDTYDLAVFTGGADICPFLYGELPHKTYNGYLVRDRHEVSAIHRARFGTPMVGICRGAQLLNAHAGGSMYQDVDGHHGNHDAVVVSNGQVVNINSIHHQMMIPTAHAETIMKAGVSRRKERNNTTIYVKEEGLKALGDPEALFIPHHNYLCFQAHPEYAHKGSDTRRVFEAFMAQYIVPLLSNKGT